MLSGVDLLTGSLARLSQVEVMLDMATHDKIVGSLSASLFAICDYAHQRCSTLIPSETKVGPPLVNL